MSVSKRWSGGCFLSFEVLTVHGVVIVDLALSLESVECLQIRNVSVS